MTDRISHTSSAPTTEFILGCDRISQSVVGNYTKLRVYLKAFNRGYEGSYSNYPGTQTASIDGVGTVGVKSQDPFLPIGTPNGFQRWHHYWDINIPHGADGKRGAITLRMSLKYDNGYVHIVKTAKFSDFPAINVQRAPSATTKPKVDQIKSTSVRYSFSEPEDLGNAPILDREVGYGLSSGSPDTVVVSNSPIVISGLTPSKRYYFWSRARNKNGKGPWSARVDVNTISTPPKTTPLSLTKEGPLQVKYRFQGNGNGGAPLLEWQVGYGTNPDTPSTFLTSTGTSIVDNITNGMTWYFWSRGRNSEGWGPWSAKLSIKTPTGVRIKIDDDKYVEAIAFVKHDGIYKESLPYVKYTGVYKETG